MVNFIFLLWVTSSIGFIALKILSLFDKTLVDGDNKSFLDTFGWFETISTGLMLGLFGYYIMR